MIMKGKTISPSISNILILIISSVLFECQKMDPEPVLALPNSYKEAVIEIDKLKNNLLNKAGNHSFILKSINSVKPGQIWIWNDCDNTIQNNAENSMYRITTRTYEIESEELTSNSISFYWDRTWVEKNDLKRNIQYDLLEYILRAAYEYPEIYAYDFKINLVNIKRSYLTNVDLLFNDYQALLLSNNDKAKGNILVTGVMEGQVHIEYRALNNKKEKTDIDLAVVLNEMLGEISFKPGFRYFNKISSDSEYDEIEERSLNLTAFIIEYYPIPVELQDLPFTTDNLKEACDYNAIKPKIKKFPGICTETGKEVIELSLHFGESSEEWYPVWVNKTEHTLTFFKYNLLVKNRFGQVIGRNDYFELGNIDPGSIIYGNKITNQSPGTISYAPKTIVDLYEVEMEFHLQTYNIVW